MNVEHRGGYALNRRAGFGRRRPNGRLAGFEALESREVPAALIWSPGISLPAARAGAAAILDGQTVLAVGGGTATVNSLDPGNTSWGAVQPIDLARSYAGVGSTGSTLLVYGGSGGGAALDAALTYDPYNIDNIQDAAVMSVPRTRFAAATDGGVPYAIGGLDDSGNVLASVERYDVGTNTWRASPRSRKGSSPPRRSTTAPGTSTPSAGPPPPAARRPPARCIATRSRPTPGPPSPRCPSPPATPPRRWAPTASCTSSAASAPGGRCPPSRPTTRRRTPGRPTPRCPRPSARRRR